MILQTKNFNNRLHEKVNIDSKDIDHKEILGKIGRAKDRMQKP